MITCTYLQFFLAAFIASVLVKLIDSLVDKYKKRIKVYLKREDLENLFKGAFFSREVALQYLAPECGFEVDITDVTHSISMNFANPKWTSAKLGRLCEIYAMRTK